MGELEPNTDFALEAQVLDANDNPVVGNLNYEVRNSITNITISSGSMTHISGGIYVAVVQLSVFGQYRVKYTISGFPDHYETIYITDTTDSEYIKIIKQIQTNRWKILNNRFIIYSDDGITALWTFDLKDAYGNPTEINPMERKPI